MNWKEKIRRSPLVCFMLGYLGAICVISLGIGVVRSVWRFATGTLPDQYLLHGVAWNAGLALAFGIAFFPVVLFVAFLFRNAHLEKRAETGILLAIPIVCFSFWILNTSARFYQPVAKWTVPFAQESLYWLPALAVQATLWWLFLSKRPVKIVFRRILACFVILIVVTLGFGVYGVLKDPSTGRISLQASAIRRPPIFLVLIDTLRADHLSVYGYGKPTSPNMDAVASQGTTYTRAFSQAPWTRPSCGSLLTSRYPPEIGLRGIWSPLPSSIPILPQFMKVEGYSTAGIVSSVHLSAQYGFDKGWDVLDIGTTYLRWTGARTPLARLRLIPRTEYYPRYNAEELTDRAIQWIDAPTNSSQPIFMYLHYSDPHGPYKPPSNHDRWRAFSDESTRTLVKPPHWPPEKGEVFSQIQKNALMARYDAEISFFDYHFGRFLAHLKERGLYKDALLIITADHGEEFEDHSGWGHGHTLYNELLHVPLIIKYPDGLKQDRESFRHEIVGLIDIIPTIRDVIGAEWPASGFRGQSLLTPMKSQAPRIIYADNDKPSLRTGYRAQDKLIQILDESGKVLAERYHSIDSDFREDGDGKIPSGVPVERLVTLRSLMAAIYQKVISPEKIDVDQETREELEALGYLN